MPRAEAQARKLIEAFDHIAITATRTENDQAVQVLDSDGAPIIIWLPTSDYGWFVLTCNGTEFARVKEDWVLATVVEYVAALL